jgi:subtilisin family serine protease
MKYPLIRVEERLQRAGKEEAVIARTAAVADHVVVKTAPELPQASVAKRVELIGGTVRKKSAIAGTYLVSFPLNDKDRLPDIIRELRRQPEFHVVEPDYVATVDVTPDDSRFLHQWSLQRSAEGGIDAEQAWDLARGSISIVVGVIDTGIDYNHPDLGPNIWTNPGEIAGNGIDDDHNGYIDDVHGWDFANNDSNPMDDHFHGTHVAGTIGAATNNAAGVAGVCWNVRLMALKFLNASGSGYISDATEALHYANNRGVALTNNSWGGGSYTQSFADELGAARNAGSIFIAAAGNSSSNSDYWPSYPAGYDLDNVVAVAAVDHFGSLAYFSNYGAATVDLAAPGVGILSTLPTAMTSAMAGYGLSTGYGSLNGTSMAAPHVAGVCGLVKAFRPSLTYGQILNTLYAGGERLNSLSDKIATGARLNANRSLESLNGLLISPFGNLIYSGPTAGPFAASPNQWLLSNPGASPVSWSASSDQAWATVSPASGTLAPGQTAVVVGNIGVSANTFPPGQYVARISFLNTSAGKTEIRTMSLRIEGVAPMPFHDDFESGALNAYWRSSGFSWPGSVYRNQVTAAYGPQGGFHLLLDASANTSAPVRNEVTVALNLQGYTGVQLQFAAKSLEDEPDGPPPQPFIQSADFDGVAVSADGVNWYEIQSLRTLSSEYQQFGIDLDQAIASCGLSYSSVFKIRFNHVDNAQAPVDGIAIDNIYITGVPPSGITLTVPERLVEGQSGTAQMVRSGAIGNTLTVNLSANPSSRVAVPASVTFPAGQQSVSFAVTALDNTYLDGAASAVITAADSGSGSAQGTCFVVDNETAELSLSAPALLNEGSGLFAEGRVSSDRPPVNAIVVTLSSSRPDELQMPPTVVLPAGATSVSFSVAAVDDEPN